MRLRFFKYEFKDRKTKPITAQRKKGQRLNDCYIGGYGLLKKLAKSLENFFKSPCSRQVNASA
jgi:hypothetical protein